MIYQTSDNDKYRIEGNYGEPSEWRMQTKISSNDYCITTENIASLYFNTFFDQVSHTERSYSLFNRCAH
jgi:hypothetical protein